MTIKYKSIVKGTGSFLLKSWRTSGPGNQGVFDSRGSYAIFMRYVAALGRVGVSFEDKVIVEFGPGASYGMGIAALLSGAKRYYAFDLIDQTSDDRNLSVFDELAELFRKRAPVPIDGFCGRIFPFLDDYSFPSALVSDEVLGKSLHSGRLKAIRDDLAARRDVFFRVRSTDDLPSASIDEPADIIISESVLEHVDDLESTYQAFGRWLAPDGAMVHLIDYSSHNLSSSWNGHWACSPLKWSLVRGRRHYLINRRPHQHHVDRLCANGFTVVHSDLLRRVDGITLDAFSSDFREMSYLDSTTSLAAITCRRAPLSK